MPTDDRSGGYTSIHRINFQVQFRAINMDGRAPLHIAVINGHHATVELLLRMGGWINQMLVDGLMAGLLLRYDPQSIDALDGKGHTPLFRAMKHGYGSVVN